MYEMRLLLMHTGTLSSSLWTLKCWTVQCPITSMGLETDYVMKSCSAIMIALSYHQDYHDFLHSHEDPTNDGSENTRQSLSNMHAQLTKEPCQGFQFISEPFSHTLFIMKWRLTRGCATSTRKSNISTNMPIAMPIVMKMEEIVMPCS